MTERLDGNAIAAVMFELFGRELTTAMGVCGSCGARAVLAQMHIYVAAGIVARCPACEAVLLRVVEGPTRSWLDLSGFATLELPW